MSHYKGTAPNTTQVKHIKTKDEFGTIKIRKKSKGPNAILEEMIDTLDLAL